MGYKIIHMNAITSAKSLRFPFDERKAAEVAAFFLLKAQARGSNISILKLMKLMYLAERASYQQFGAPLVGDSLYSLPHGPVMSTTLSLINSVAEEREGGDYWDSLIAERTDGKYMCLREGKIKSTEDLLYLSEADCEILEKVWSDFGGLSAIKLRAYTHDPDNCPEWEDPNGSSRPISLDTMLTSMGYSPDAIEIICNNIAQMAATNASLKPQVRF
ncbi:hypothetical protein B1757_02760 [Acidithiobacillus marinus]|uniref:Antitoxin SocA-like Panacea domain-containing protein n=2 Tax=Acidithiobacillus marinus TaxID=187490 RepID=A0A2I1DPB6_9PROT|nr:hypothetical protein B1757_02760 [Acidithiobacillus marinus]